MMNRLYNCKNPYQGAYKKVLCVCSAGLLRSPTIAWVLSNEPYNYNTRAAGVHDYALVPVDNVLLTWADEVVCAAYEHAEQVEKLMKQHGIYKDIVVLDILDIYAYRDPNLVALIRDSYEASTTTRMSEGL